MQDTVVRALERADQYRGESSPRPRLHRVMYHGFIDGVRRRTPDLVDDEAWPMRRGGVAR